MANKFLSILGKVGSGILKGADAGAKAGVPIATQIDAIADALKGIKGQDGSHDAAIATVVTNLQDLKTVVPEVVQSPKAALQSNRFKMALIGLGAALFVSWGFPVDIANQAMEAIFYIVSAYVLGDTLRPSTTVTPVVPPKDPANQ